jgi:hypothetical protein
MMRRWLLMLLLISGQAAALPDAVRSAGGEVYEGREWHEWGNGEMTWFGLKLYRATLWVAGQKGGQKDGRLRPESPFALALEYRRDIAGERIVQASVDEMRKLGAGDEQLRIWEAEMRRVFPDVRKGDVLIGVHLPGSGARFFFREREIGTVQDAEFARRFFAIWLDPKTSAPDVRAALLRQPEN